MSYKRVYAVFLRQFLLMRHSLPRILQIFYWSTFDLFIWGVITKYLGGIGGEKFGFLTILIGAIILWNFFTRVMAGITVSFLEDIWSRNFINLFTSPLSIGEYIAGLTLVSAMNTFLSITVMSALAWFFMSYNIFQFDFYLLPFIFTLFISGWSLGIIATSTILYFGPAVEIFVWTLPTFIMPFAGVFYPVEALPEIFQPIARLLPISYVFEGMRQVVNGGVFDVNIFIYALVLSLIYFLAAIAILYKVYGAVLRLGLFTRFIAE